MAKVLPREDTADPFSKFVQDKNPALLSVVPAYIIVFLSKPSSEATVSFIFPSFVPTGNTLGNKFFFIPVLNIHSGQ